MNCPSIRPAAVAGSWYPGTAVALGDAIDRCLSAASAPPAGPVVAVVAPHAGLMYSGGVAAHAYRTVVGLTFDVVVLIGPSHFVGFEGVAAYGSGRFDTPLGPAEVSDPHVQALLRASSVVTISTAPHMREHSLELQLPFLRRVLPATPIVPLLMGHQTRETIEALGRALGAAFAGQRALLVASTDLSHYHDRRTAVRLDGRVMELVRGFDTQGLLAALESYPEGERGRSVGCGIGPAVSVMLAARSLGACGARILRYADSGDVSGDTETVVGYLAAAFGQFEDHADRP